VAYLNKYIIEAYSGIFDGLEESTKKELIEKLSGSLYKSKSDREKKFFKSFGAFASTKPASKIAAEIRVSRKFRRKEIKL
jgi:hypothetical protein